MKNFYAQNLTQDRNLVYKIFIKKNMVEMTGIGEHIYSKGYFLLYFLFYDPSW